MAFYIVQFLTGLASAASLFLVASGLSIIFGVTRIVNFAHGAFYMLGAYVAFTLTERFSGAFGFWGGIVIAALALVVAQVVAVPSVAAFSLARGDNFIMEGLTPVLTAYALAFVIFMAAVRFDRPRSLLLSRIGLISYSMYLFHWPVNITVYRVLPLTGQIGDIATMLICSGLVLLVSWLVYRLVERPMIMFGRAIVLRHGVASRP